MKEPLLGHLSPAVKLLFVLLLSLSCFIVISLAGVLIAIPFFHINLLTDPAVLTDFNNPSSVAILKYLQIIQSIGIFLVPAILAGFFFGGNSSRYLGFNKSSYFSVYTATFLVMFISLPLINWITSVNELLTLPEAFKSLEQWMKETEGQAAEITETFLKADSVGGLLLNILMIAVIPAIGEEVLFRGLLQRLFSEWFKNIHVAVIFTAILFGMIHMQFYGVLPRILLGLLFGYLFYWSGSLWVPVFAHFINNGAAVIIAFLSNRGFISVGYEDFGATSNAILIAGSLFSTGIILFAIYWRIVLAKSGHPQQ